MYVCDCIGWDCLYLILMLDLFLISLQCSIDFYVFISLLSLFFFLILFCSAKDCIIIFIFIIVWHLYRLTFEVYFNLCVYLCVAHPMIVNSVSVWLLLLLLLRVFSSSLGTLLSQHWKQHTKRQNMQQSILFSSQCFLFGERVLYVVVVRGFVIFF